MSAEQAVNGRSKDAICRRLDEQRYVVDGRELQLPMEIADCALLLNAFAVDAPAADVLLAGTGLSAARVLPGKAVLLLLAVDYRDNPLGDYNEAAVLLSALPPGESKRPWFAGALSMLSLGVPYFVYRMPVDQEFTAHAGRFLWGYPKYLANIDLAFDGRRARARLSQDGELVFAMRAPRRAGGGTLRERTGYNLTLRAGTLRRIAGTVGGRGLSVSPGGEPPEIGSAHPLARELRSLGLPKRPLLSVSLDQARMRFGTPQVL